MYGWGAQRRDHVRQRLHPVGGDDDRAAVRPSTWATYGTRGGLSGWSRFHRSTCERVVAQLLERRGGVDLGGDAELLGQEVPRGDAPAA